MGIIWDDYDTEDMFDEFSTPFLWFQARQSSELRQGLNALNTSAIFGYYYNPPIAVDLVRTSISYRIINSEYGRIYKGGAKIQIPPIRLIDGSFRRLPIYDQIFKGDILVAVDKPIRDYDVLTKGVRDKVFAFDIKQILSVISLNANKQEVVYQYGADYTIQVNGIDVEIEGTTPQIYPITIKNQYNIITFGNLNSFGDFIFGDYELFQPGAISNITVVWTNGGNHPPQGDKYAIEFTCNPNYIVFDDVARPRGTTDNDLPKVVNAVKRAYVNEQANPLDKINTDQTIMNEPPIYTDGQYSGEQ